MTAREGYAMATGWGRAMTAREGRAMTTEGTAL